MNLLQTLADKPYELLVELERRARAAITAAAGGADSTAEEWVGVGFRLGAEKFVAGRADVREVLPVPTHLTRVPGAKTWLRGIANVRGQLLTIVDLKAFLGAGTSPPDRRGRILVAAGREVPTGVIVDEVLGFRRFSASEYRAETPAAIIRCENYLQGGYRRGSEVWPCFSFSALLKDEQFLMAGETARA